MNRSKRDIAWIVIFTILTILAVPWFLWGNETIIAGLPIWLWWHIGWMGLAAVIFYLFTKTAWDRIIGTDERPALDHEHSRRESDQV